MQALLPRLHVFQEGTCIVHHLFGAEVSEMVKAAYGDAFLTAHFEVLFLAVLFYVGPRRIGHAACCPCSSC